jgi:hypothetical protein
MKFSHVPRDGSDVFAYAVVASAIRLQLQVWTSLHILAVAPCADHFGCGMHRRLAFVVPRAVAGPVDRGVLPRERGDDAVIAPHDEGQVVDDVTRPLCGGSGTVTQSLRQCEPGSDVLIRFIITAIADYAAETTERRVALGSPRGSHGEERRHLLLNIRRSCCAVSAPRCQAGVPPPFCSHGYERASPEPNPVRRLAGTSRSAIRRDGGATQRK